MTYLYISRNQVMLQNHTNLIAFRLPVQVVFYLFLGLIYKISR